MLNICSKYMLNICLKANKKLSVLCRPKIISTANDCFLKHSLKLPSYMNVLQ